MQITEERRKRVIDLYFNQHKSYAEIVQLEKMLPRDIHAIIKEELARRQDGHSRKRIDWKKQVMPAITDRLQDFDSCGIIPTLRAMFYALVSLRVIPNLQPQYQYLSHFTARARENGELPMDCFADQSRRIVQDFNDIYQSPEEYTGKAIKYLKNAANEYCNTILRWHNNQSM